MSYKTKFRELDVFQVDDTKSLMEQIDSIGHDANSARSLGAAFYRNMQRYPHRFSRAGIRTVVQMSLPNVVRKMIAGSTKLTGETTSYVIRIQGIDYLASLKDFLSSKFRNQIEDKINVMRELDKKDKLGEDMVKAWKKVLHK